MLPYSDERDIFFHGSIHCQQRYMILPAFFHILCLFFSIFLLVSRPSSLCLSSSRHIVSVILLFYFFPSRSYIVSICLRCPTFAFCFIIHVLVMTFFFFSLHTIVLRLLSFLRSFIFQSHLSSFFSLSLERTERCYIDAR